MRRRMLGLLAAPMLVGQCAPQCAPVLTPPPPVTAPPSGSYTFLTTNAAGQYTRWSGCDNPIRWQLDVQTLAPTAAEEAALVQALATAAAATGHTFERAPNGGPTAAPGVEAVLGFKDFPSPQLGEGGGAFTSSMRMFRGTVYVDTGLAPDVLRTSLIHEIAHMLGLGHVDDATQVMYRVLRSPSPQDYQAGDREGLRLVGASMPCVQSLDARSDGPVQEIILE